MRRIAAALLLAALCNATSAAAAPPTLTAAPAPNFTARTLEGAKVDLTALLAKGPVVIDFWATWCRPCLESLPALERLRAKWQERGVSVVAISIDGPRNLARVRPLVQRLGLHMPVIVDDDGTLQQRYQVSSVPTSLLIASDGRIVRARTGYLPGEDEQLAAAVEALLAPAAADSAR